MKSGDLDGAQSAFETAENFKDSISPKESLNNNMAELAQVKSN